MDSVWIAIVIRAINISNIQMPGILFINKHLVPLPCTIALNFAILIVNLLELIPPLIDRVQRISMPRGLEYSVFIDVRHFQSGDSVISMSPCHGVGAENGLVECL